MLGVQVGGCLLTMREALASNAKIDLGGTSLLAQHIGDDGVSIRSSGTFMATKLVQDQFEL